MSMTTLIKKDDLAVVASSEKALEESYYAVFANKSEHNTHANELQQRLNRHYKQLMSEPKHFLEIPDDASDLLEIRSIENAWSRYLDLCISKDLPKSKKEFREWYASVNNVYKSSVKPFFEYFSNHATLEELAIYLIYEQEVDGSFDDIVALGQIGLQGKSKMVLAENYWDEMGNGVAEAVHTTMFADSVDYLRAILNQTNPKLDVSRNIPTDILANGNMLLMYANRRKYIARLLGAITILEDTAPDRFISTVSLMKKHNLPEQVIRYHEVHVCCDCRHGEDLLDHVLMPLIMDGSDMFLSEVCKGILVRLYVALEYYKSMKHTFETLLK